MQVSFDEEPQYVQRAADHSSRGLYALMMRWGFAKDQKQAEVVLVVLAAIALLAAIGIWLLSGTSTQGPTHEELIRMQQLEGV